MGSISITLVLTILSFEAFSVHGQTYLRADGVSDTYSLIDRVLAEKGSAVEVPDCKHKVKHITMEEDSELKRDVFLFHAHVNKDDDRCQKSDRQRTEIKTYSGSPGSLKGFQGETVSFSWNFKLDARFQPSKGFTHIHQLKAVGGDDGTPIITLTPRKSSPDIFQVIHVDSKGKKTYIGQGNLAPFKGTWVHVAEEVTYSTKGKYSVTITKISDGATLLKVSKSNLEMWRKDTTFVRPKWGIYRSLANKDQLRDEIVRFDTFCLGKGKARCK